MIYTAFSRREWDRYISVGRRFFGRKICFYFIPSSEFNVYLKQIKSGNVDSGKISYFFTSDEYDLYLFIVANRDYFDNLGLNFFPKRS